MSYIKEGYEITPTEYKTLSRFQYAYNEHGGRAQLGWLLARCKLQDINTWLRSVKEKIGAPLPVESACSNLYGEHIQSFLHDDPQKTTMHYHAFYDCADLPRGLNTDFYGGEVTNPLIKINSQAAKDVFDAENPNLALVLGAVKAVGPRTYPGYKQFVKDPRYDYSEGSYAVGNIMCFDRSAGQFCAMDQWIGLEGYRESYKCFTIFRDAANNFFEQIKKSAELRALMVRRLGKVL